MAVLILHTLKEEQRKDILQLITTCNEYDGLRRQPVLDEGDNYNQELRSFVLYYHREELLSVLLIYQPYPDEAEITAYTLPSFRRQGYFRALYSKALKELVKYHIKNAAFVTENHSIDGKACALSMKAVYKRSDYLLSYQFQEEEEREKLLGLLSNRTDFFITALSKENFESGILTFQMIFGWEREEADEILKETLESVSSKSYLAYVGNKVVGIASLHLGKAEASLYGFGILEEFRGAGYGKYFLAWILNALWNEEKSKVNLQVESESCEALALYRKMGFITVEQYDYYYKKI